MGRRPLIVRIEPLGDGGSGDRAAALAAARLRAGGAPSLGVF
ncbi:hypothetical protein [Kitasatospora kazusensis]